MKLESGEKYLIEVKPSSQLQKPNPPKRKTKKDLKLVDLTSAGDLFAAGYLHGYINKLSTKECLIKRL